MDAGSRGFPEELQQILVSKCRYLSDNVKKEMCVIKFDFKSKTCNTKLQMTK